jgi:nucleoside-diphosphate-sugar epimerase
MPQSILITGAQGMLGNALAQYLLKLTRSEESYKPHIYLTSRNWSKTAKDYWSQFSNFKTIKNLEIANIGKPIQSVIHAASPSNITKIVDIATLRSANIDIMRNILELKPQNFIFISSGEVYKGIGFRENEEVPAFSESVNREWYPLVKLEGEFLLNNYARDWGAATTSIRLFHTFGPGVKRDDGRSFADILWGAALKKEIVLNSKGNQTRSFLYLADAVSGILTILLNPMKGNKIVNLGSNIIGNIYGLLLICSNRESI